MSGTAVLIGTLDTKEREYAFVRDILTAAGISVILVDVGVLHDPSLRPDVTAAEVANSAGVSLTELRKGTEDGDARAFAVATMQRGAISIIARLREEGKCDGVLGLGGSGGSELISAVMRSLPLGVPKVLVSTMVSGDVGSYVGVSDLLLLHSVTDIAGLNRVSRAILRNAAGALVGMLALPADISENDRPAVGITMLGITTPCALRIVDRLSDAGIDPIVFHAVGSGGRALESLLAAGIVSGVVDLTVKEVTDELLGGVFVAGPERMRTAGRLGVPQVVVPGAVEVINFGAFNTVPAHFSDGSRPVVRHNAHVTAVRASREELARVADELAARLNIATGPLEVVIPTEGFDSYASHGGPFADPSADAHFVRRLREALRSDIAVTEVESDINAVAFADLVAERFLKLSNGWLETADRQGRRD